MEMLNDWTTTKSYANRANLDKALVANRLDRFMHLVVLVPGTARLTAVFPKSFLGNDLMVPVWAGFKVLG